MHEELVQAGIISVHWLSNATFTHSYLMSADAEDVIDLCTTREAYLARYGRIPPSELDRMSAEKANTLFAKIADTVANEFKARAAANPFMPAREDDAG